MSGKTSVVLLNLGGPDSLESVEGFLKNLFADPDIFTFPGGSWTRRIFSRLVISRRLRRVQAAYAQIGGASPLPRLMSAMARALEKELGQDVQVLSGMRYWHPLIEETLCSIPADHRVVLVSLYPHACIATTGSSFHVLERTIAANRLRFPKVACIESYPEDSGFVASWVHLIEQSLGAQPFDPRATRIVFSAHGIPMSMVRSGDPYQKQVLASVDRIMAALPSHLRVSHQVAYQSRMGPVRWLEPNVRNVISSLPQQGVQTVVVVPISFTVENLETLFELDIELRELAESVGIHDFRRVATPNADDRFVRALAGLIREHI